MESKPKEQGAEPLLTKSNLEAIGDNLEFHLGNGKIIALNSGKYDINFLVSIAIKLMETEIVKEYFGVEAKKEKQNTYTG